MRHVVVPVGTMTASVPEISGPAFHHLARVVRVRVGETLRLTDGCGATRDGEVTVIGSKTITVAASGPIIQHPRPAPSVTIAQALAKGDRFEDVLQHGTECGAARFQPLQAQRSVVRLPREAVQGKLERWRGITVSAAEQCGRPWLPDVAEPVSVRDIAASLGGYDLSLITDVDGRRLAGVAADCGRPPGTIIALVGPEGGFTGDEVACLVASGAVRTSLGPYTLRTETAALVALAQITLLWGA